MIYVWKGRMYYRIRHFLESMYLQWKAACNTCSILSSTGNNGISEYCQLNSSFSRKKVKQNPGNVLKSRSANVLSRKVQSGLLNKLNMKHSNIDSDQLDGCIVWNTHNTVFGSKLPAICAVAVYFLHSTPLMSRDSIVDRH